jgi:hypothetical protein
MLKRARVTGVIMPCRAISRSAEWYKDAEKHIRLAKTTFLEGALSPVNQLAPRRFHRAISSMLKHVYINYPSPSGTEYFFCGTLKQDYFYILLLDVDRVLH